MIIIVCVYNRISVLEMNGSRSDLQCAVMSYDLFIQFYYFRVVQKNGLSNQNSSKPLWEKR